MRKEEKLSRRKLGTIFRKLTIIIILMKKKLTNLINNGSKLTIKWAF
jgi:hypothetical protein